MFLQSDSTFTKVKKILILKNVVDLSLTVHIHPEEFYLHKPSNLSGNNWL